jgi:hypothetical protein
MGNHRAFLVTMGLKPNGSFHGTNDGFLYGFGWLSQPTMGMMGILGVTRHKVPNLRDFQPYLASGICVIFEVD